MMRSKQWRSFVLFAGALGFCVGCASVPPGPGPGATRPAGASSAPQEDDGDGWLFKKLTGQDKSSAETQSAATGVVPASATEPITSPAQIAKEAAKDDDSDSEFDWSDLSPTKVYADLKKAAGYGPDEGKAQAFLKEGEELFRQKKYVEAADKFKAAGKRWPDSPLEEDALFMEAESRFFADQYPKAQDCYDNLLKKYDNSRHTDTVVKRVFSIGQYWEGMYKEHPHWPVTPNVTDGSQPRFDTFGNALKSYEIVRLRDPTGPLADDSVMATANAYFQMGRYEDAAFHYDLLRKEYSNSEFQPQAHVLGMKSKLEVYQGSQYDETPLKEADEIADQALTQFRDQLGEEAARVAQTRNAIVEQKAEREWYKAQFYEKKQYFRAARGYYQSIVQQYPRSQFAVQSRQRLEAIAGKPDMPPNHFKWLTDRFPSEND